MKRGTSDGGEINKPSAVHYSYQYMIGHDCEREKKGIKLDTAKRDKREFKTGDAYHFFIG